MAVIQRVGSPAKPRKWMSVHEMGDMLVLKSRKPIKTSITASPDTVHRKIVRKMQLQRQPVSVCRKWPGCLTFQEVPYMES